MTRWTRSCRCSISSKTRPVTRASRSGQSAPAVSTTRSAKSPRATSPKSEILGLPAAAIVLLIVFGALVAAGLPLILSMLAIFVAMGITGVLEHFVPMGDFVENMIIMIGLAVGIDYSLFIIERFREERAGGLDKIEAITRTGATASRAVLFSGITVIIALASLLIMPDTFFHGLSLGAMAAAVGALAAAMTLLPAALSLLGDKVNALHLPGRGKPSNHAEATHGFWHRTTSAVMKHPVIAIVATVAILGAAAAPLATIELGSSGISQLPQNAESVQGVQHPARRVHHRPHRPGRRGHRR